MSNILYRCIDRIYEPISPVILDGKKNNKKKNVFVKHKCPQTAILLEM